MGFVSTEANLIKTVFALVHTSGAKPFIGGGGITASGKPYERVRWVDYRMYATFERVGLHPRKSLTMQDLNLPRGASGSDYFWLFIRGVFEGDGTILQTADGESPREVRFVTGSPVFAAWMRRQMHLRGVYGCSEFSSWEGHKNARIVRVSTVHTHFLRRKMYDDWDERFGEFGHPEKKARLARKRIHIDSRPGQQKKRKTLRKIESALISCHDQLGRWPDSGEYDRVRARLAKTLADPRDFPIRGCILKHFGTWKSAVEFVEKKYPHRASGEAIAVERAMLWCHSQLGRWPSSYEYERLRKEFGDLENRKDFPAAASALARFMSWENVLTYMREHHPRLVDKQPPTTKQRIESALLETHDELGRWPNGYEYDCLRQQLATRRGVHKREYPSLVSVRQFFDGWAQLIAYLQDKYPQRTPAPSTLDRAERALLFCHQLFGHWPSSYEYKVIRKRELLLASDESIPSASAVSAILGDWQQVVTYMRVLHPELLHVEPETLLAHKAENAMRLCHKELGRWPLDVAEYESVRKRLLPTVANPRDLPSYPSIYKACGGWRNLLACMQSEAEMTND
jgi:hypothetical protein